MEESIRMAEAAGTFNFELVSPEKVLVSQPAWQVTIPGEEGYFGVRAGHMSLIAAVKAGVVEVIAREGEAPQKIFIAGGFADVTAKNCTLLAEQAVNVNELDAEKIQQQVNELEFDVKNATDPVQKAMAHKKLETALAKLAAVKGNAAH